MKRIIPIIIILAAIGGGYWWFNQQAATSLESGTGQTGLVGSGSIEAETVIITAELGGRVTELKVDEGDEVKANQILVELDKADLLAQHIQLEAGLTAAQAHLDLIRARARPEDIAVAKAQLAQAEIATAGVRQTWLQAQTLVNTPHELEANVNRSQAQVTEAERNLETAQVNLKRANIQAEAAGRNQLNHEALVQNEVAQYQLQAAQTGLEIAEVALAGNQRLVEHWIAMRDRPVSLMAQANALEAAYRQAEAAVLMAEANLVAVKADPMAEEIAVAQAQLGEAETALVAINVLLAKQTLTAPRDGLITQKLINPGELAAPGMALLEVSDIDSVDLIVYIPETRIGEVKIGQEALVYVDAYGEEEFEGNVSFIAHEAEFTPRNVQTQEERVNLVFAVKITLDNADHRLKPGMPADAEILLFEQLSPTPKPSSTPRPQATVAPTARPIPTGTATPTQSPTRVNSTPTNSSHPTETPPSVEAEIVTWGLNVRAGPGVDYPVVASLSQGETVPILDIDLNSGWLKVQPPADKQAGWITDNPAYVLIK